MRIYIAGAYCARDVIRERVVPILNRLGHECTSGWLNGTRPITEGTIGASLDRPQQAVAAAAEGDFDDIESAECLLLLTAHAMQRLDHDLDESKMHTGGRHTEVGFALATGLPVFVAGPPENVFQRTMTVHHESLAETLDAIGDYGRAKQQRLAERDAALVQRDPTPSLNDMVQSAYDPRAVRFSG